MSLSLSIFPTADSTMGIPRWIALGLVVMGGLGCTSTVPSERTSHQPVSVDIPQSLERGLPDLAQQTATNHPGPDMAGEISGYRYPEELPRFVEEVTEAPEKKPSHQPQIESFHGEQVSEERSRLGRGNFENKAKPKTPTSPEPLSPSEDRLPREGFSSSPSSMDSPPSTQNGERVTKMGSNRKALETAGQETELESVDGAEIPDLGMETAPVGPPAAMNERDPDLSQWEGIQGVGPTLKSQSEGLIRLNRHFQQGSTFLESHRFQEAVEAFTLVLQGIDGRGVRPNDEDSWELERLRRDSHRKRARAQEKLGHWEEALSDMTIVLLSPSEDHDQRGEDHFLRGRIYVHLRQTDLAIPDLKEALRLGLDSLQRAQAHYLLALALLHRQELQAGLHQLDRSCRLQFEKACVFFEQMQ